MRNFRILLWGLILFAALWVNLAVSSADALLVEVDYGDTSKSKTERGNAPTINLTVEDSEGADHTYESIHVANGVGDYFPVGIDTDYDTFMKLGLSSSRYDFSYAVDALFTARKDWVLQKGTFSQSYKTIFYLIEMDGLTFGKVKSFEINLPDNGSVTVTGIRVYLYSGDEFPEKASLQAGYKSYCYEPFRIQLAHRASFSDSVYLTGTNNLVAETVFSTKIDGSGEITSASDIVKFDNIEFTGSTVLPADKYTYDNYNSYVILKNVNETRTPVLSNFFLELDIADQYQAGIDAEGYYIGKKLNELADSLYVNIRYADTMGAVHSLDLPVVTLAALYAEEYGGISGEEVIVSLLTQGSRIIIPLTLPDFACFVSDPVVGFVTGTGSTYDSGLLTQNTKTAIQANNLASEAVTLDGVIIYSAKQADSLGVGITSNGGLDFTISEDMTPYLYWKDEEGSTLTYTKQASFRLHEYNGANLERNSRAGSYLLEIRTADLEGIDTGTADDIYIDLSYVTKSGEQLSTGKLNLRELCRDFYGSVYIGFDGKYVTDGAYYAGVKPEGSNIEASYNLGYLSAREALVGTGVIWTFLDVESVGYFTSATISISGSDSWLISEFNIYSVDSATEPMLAKWTDKEAVLPLRVVNYGCLASKYAYGVSPSSIDAEYRMVNVAADEDVENEDSSAGIYIEEGIEKTINFFSKTISGVDDYALYTGYYDLTYQQACAGLPFGQSCYTYYVTVKVAGPTEGGSDSDDDSGSENFFYFKLIFENGESAYVQANQQLAGDAFRSNQTGQFTITVNHDYGDLKQIRIIPENDTEKGSPYDKLNIEYITVEMNDATGHMKNWSFKGTDGSGIGWVGIDYSDVESQTHSESEIAKQCNVDSTGTSVNLMFAVTTDASGEAFYPNFNLWADIVYRRASTGTSDKMTVDVVKAVYEFKGTIGSVKSSEGGYVTDGNMFLDGTTTRFTVPFSDIDSIESITFYGNYDGSINTYSTLFIGDVSVYVINRGNVSLERTLNYDGEVIIQNCQKTFVASIDSVDPTRRDNAVYLPQRKTFYFSNSEHNIMGGTDGSSIYTISKEPESGNDTINIIAYSAVSGQAESSGLTAEFVYKDAYGESQLSMAKLSNAGKTSDGLVKYAKYGLAVPYYAAIRNLTLTANDSDISLPIEKVIVQHVRSGVIIDSYVYYADSSANDAGTGITCSGFERLSDSGEYQLVYLELDDSMASTALVSVDHDLAVSLHILTDAENKIGYDTPNYFISDQVENIRLLPGNVLCLKLTEAGVEGVSAINISATGGLSAAIKRIAVATYENDVNTSWYSCSDGLTVTNETRTVALNYTDKSEADTVNVLDFTFTTLASDVLTGDTGCSTAIAMDIVYEDNGALKHEFISDLNDKLVSGSFEAGATASVRIMTTGINSTNIRSVRLLPYDKNLYPGATSYDGLLSENAGTNLTWGVDTIRVDFGDGEDFTKAEAKKYIYVRPSKLILSRTGLEVILSNASLEAVINYNDPVTLEAAETITLLNESTEIVLPYSESGADISIDVSLYDSGKGWTASAGNQTAYGSISVTETAGMTMVSGNYTVHITGDAEHEVVKTVTFRTVENTERFITITFRMQNYQDTTGTTPVKVVASSTAGETTTAYSGQEMSIALGTNASVLTFACTSEQNIIPVVSVAKVSGPDVSYEAEDTHDGAFKLTFGDRNTTASVYQVTFTYTLNGITSSIICTVNVQADSSSDYKTSPATLSYSYEKDSASIYGVLATGRTNTITVPKTADFVLDITKSSAKYTLTDETAYNDTVVTEEEGGEETETEEEARTEEESEPEIIPDPDRAELGDSAVTLPSADKTYIFDYNGTITVKRK